VHCVVDMWPASTCSCRPSPCGRPQLEWDFSFSRISPTFVQSVGTGSDAAQSIEAKVGARRCEASHAVTRLSLAGDTDQISTLAGALDRLSTLASRLRSDLGRVARACSSSLESLHRRLTFHSTVALGGGVRRVFQDAFASEFHRVRRRSVQPLLELGHDIMQVGHRMDLGHGVERWNWVTRRWPTSSVPSNSSCSQPPRRTLLARYTVAHKLTQ